MSFTLTEWWVALTKDLTRLEPKVRSSHSEPWEAARAMAIQGVQIEGNALSGRTYANNIEAAAVRLGTPFIDDSQRPHHLPDVNDPDQLLFSIIYYQHLLRYSKIDSSTSAFVLGPVISRRPIVANNAAKLKQRIDAYCSNQANIDAVKAAFPDALTQSGATLFEQLENMLAEQSVEEKLLGQFETDTATIIAQHNPVTEGLVSLFTKLDNQLKRKEEALRGIALYQQLIELLNEGQLTPESFENPAYLRINYQVVADKWLALNATIPEPSASTRFALNTTRSAINLLRIPVHAVNSVVRWALGWITPQFISNRAASIVDTVSNLTDAITPRSTTENKKNALIAAAQINIATLAAKLHDEGKNHISCNDFKAMTSEQISTLADKVSTIRHMVQIKSCLEQYRKEYTRGLVKFSLTGVFKTITVLMSKSILRPLIFDKVLLTLEAKELEKQLVNLIAQTEATGEFDQAAIERQITEALSKTQRNSDDILKQSCYLLFKKDSREASAKLTEVISTATERRGPQ